MVNARHQHTSPNQAQQASYVHYVRLLSHGWRLRFYKLGRGSGDSYCSTGHGLAIAAVLGFPC